MATLNFPLRFQSEQQKAKIKRIAKDHNRSMNAHILTLIDDAVELNKKWKPYPQPKKAK